MFSKINWKQKGEAIEEELSVNINGLDGIYFSLISTKGKRQAFLMFGDSSFTTMVSAKVSSKRKLNQIKKAFLGIYYDKKYQLDISEISVFTVDQSSSIFKNVVFFTNVFYYSTKVYNEKNTDNFEPKISISQYFQTENKPFSLQESMKIMFSSLEDIGMIFPEMELNELPIQEINGYKALEYTSEVQLDGVKRNVYIFIIKNEKNLLAFHAISAKESENNLEEIKKIAHSIKFKE